MRILPYHPTHVPIDGVMLSLRVTRLTVSQATAFKRSFDRLDTLDSIRQITIRKPDEMATVSVPRPRSASESDAADVLETIGSPATEREEALVGALRPLVPGDPSFEVFAISDHEIQARRKADMTPDQRRAWEALVVQEDEAIDTFIEQAITDYVTVDPGQIERVDANGAVTTLTAGADLVHAFAARADVLKLIVATIRLENFLSETRKNELRSLFGSTGSSKASSAVAPGSERVPTAAAAEPKVSVPAEAAMASHAIE